MEEIFKQYVSLFDMKIPEIERKYCHSLRVMELCEKIATSLNLSEKEIKLATMIGLLHDIGRFEQWKSHQSYSNLIIDHGDLGVELLFGKKLIDQFEIKENHEIIYAAIKYHNKYELPKLDKETELFCKIIRDADKLDIIFLVSNGEYDIINNGKEPVSKVNRNDFYEGKSLKNENIKNGNDKILLYFAFINNLNFEVSRKYIKDNYLVEKLYNNLKYQEPLKEYYLSIIQKEGV
ncbi:MAG: HD domain-containing protein [Bacilli bacterium]|nr:HD domain-containing protein [Bacilli bacterium]MDD4808589.1 HD domain-containing protein [Bacilli bacterium]